MHVVMVNAQGEKLSDICQMTNVKQSRLNREFRLNGFSHRYAACNYNGVVSPQAIAVLFGKQKAQKQTVAVDGKPATAPLVPPVPSADNDLYFLFIKNASSSDGVARGWAVFERGTKGEIIALIEDKGIGAEYYVVEGRKLSIRISID